MDGLSSAASVIAVIQLAGSLVNVCGGYIREVKDTQDEFVSSTENRKSVRGTSRPREISSQWRQKGSTYLFTTSQQCYRVSLQSVSLRSETWSRIREEADNKGGITSFEVAP